jgi:magnesium transporter
MSADEAISYMRIQAKTNLELIYYAYVTEADQTLVGVVSFREIFSAPPHKKIRDLMQSELVKVPISQDQEQIAKLFSQNDFLALPVVDEWGHMKGIVTFDDIANVVQEEATEDIQKLGAVEALDAPYWHVSFFELLRKRAGWLTLLFFGEMFTAVAMGFYEAEIQRAVVLALFIPLIISSGGNSGSQASTLIIRAMALGEVRMKDWFRVLWRELRMGMCLGMILGAIAMLRIGLFPSSAETFGEHYLLVGVTVAASILGVVMWGTLAGSMLPMFLRKMKLDPATASAPFVATLVDVTGLLIYFSAAAFLLKGKLL